jgi:uncharacterized protein (TIRG00374 family)
MEKTKRATILRLIYIGATVLVIAFIGLLDPSMNDMAVALQSFNPWWLAVCVASLLLYWLTDALLLHDITSYMYKRQSLAQSFKVGVIGLYYGELTPFATGGQPMQVVYMRRDNIPVGTSTGIVCIKFIIYEFSLCAFYILAMLLRGEYYYTNFNQVFWLSMLGFVMNLFAVLIILLTIGNKKLLLKWGSGLIRFLAKIKLIKKQDQEFEKFERLMEDYHIAASYILKHKLRAVGSFFLSVVNLGLLFIITYFIYLAFGGGRFGVLDFFFMQAFLYLAVSFIPTPGAAGAVEGGFLFFFNPLFTHMTAYMPMLIWRFFTFYLILIVGGIFTVLEEVFTMRRLKKKAADERCRH